MIQETLHSLRLSLYERIGSPFLATYTLALITINWKLTLLLVADLSYDDKVGRIVALYPASHDRLLGFVCYPALVGLLWLVCWPLASLVFTTWWQWMQTNIQNLRIRVQRRKALTEREAAEIYAIIDAQETKYLEIVKDRQEKIASISRQADESRTAQDERASKLQASIAARDEQIETLIARIDELGKDLETRMQEIRKLQATQTRSQQNFENLYQLSNELAPWLPGLKEFTKVIGSAPNYQAEQTWLRAGVIQQNSDMKEPDYQRLLKFYLAIGLLTTSEDQRHIGFGEQYLFRREAVLEAPPVRFN